MNLQTIRKTFVLYVLVMSTYASAISLSELTNSALNNSPKIKKVEIIKQMQVEEVNQVGELPDPTISYTWFGETPETKVGPQEQIFGIQQKLPWIGKLSDQKKLVREKINITKNELSSSKAQIVLAVRMTWSEIQFQQLNLQVIDSTISLYVTWREKLLADYQSGRQSYSRVIKMENEINILKDDRKTILRILSDKEASLTELINSDDISKMGLDSNFILLAKKTGTQAWPDGFEKNPKLKTIKAQSEFWKQKKSLSKNGYIPDFMIGLSYIQVGDAPGMPESGKDPWAINVGMSLPLSFDKTSSAIRESQLGVERSNSIYEEQNLWLSNQSQQIKNQIEEAIRKRVLYENLILVNVEQSIQVQEKSYQSGQQDFMQLLDDYRMRLKIQKTIYLSYKSEFQGKVKLLWLNGDENPDYEFSFLIENQTNKGGSND